jgi:sulfatase modifying factor 1
MFRAKENRQRLKRWQRTVAILIFIFLLISAHLPFSWAAKDKIGLDLEWRPIKGVETATPPGPKPSEPVTPCQTWQEPVTGMVFAWVPGGCFEMGTPDSEKGRDPNEGPVHKVCVDGFWMGQNEVTNAQYRRFKSGHDSKEYKGNSLNGDNQPAVYVSWFDARAFADWLSRQNSGKYTFRLPTEAEWEFACRAGTRKARFWGDDPDDACRYANV